MNYVRLMLFSVMTYMAYNQVSEDIISAFSNEEIVKVAGVLNVWASYGLLLLCPYFLAHTVNNQFNLFLRLGNGNRIVLFIVLFIAPLLAIATYSQSKSNVTHYVECKSERQFSSRYSSRTYALNEQLCQELSSK